VRVHVLFDGRDVGEKSAEIYVARLESVMAELRSADFDVEAASGGGRMRITMDRYEAEWSMVERGWATHVLGAARHFSSLNEALAAFRAVPGLTDQVLPEFVIAKNGTPVGRIKDGDGVVLFNFRGDRAIEISRAFTEQEFTAFPRPSLPKVFFAGMMQYDGDLGIPANYLVSPPRIDDTMSEHLVSLGIRQFACSETQKFGHVTYFWNGNRSGYFDQKLEEYVEIPSEATDLFVKKPWMKAFEITEAATDRMRRDAFDFGRINYANGDMVGHTGNLESAVMAVSTVDLMLGSLIEAARQTDTLLMVTADHGNCDEMFDEKEADHPDWEKLPSSVAKLRPKTAHTLNPVPFYFYDPHGKANYRLEHLTKPSLGNIANTVFAVMGLPLKSHYLPPLITRVTSS